MKENIKSYKLEIRIFKSPTSSSVSKNAKDY